MLDKLLGSIGQAVPFLNSLSSASTDKGGAGGSIIDKVVAPIASAVTTAATTASKVVDEFLPPVAKKALGSVENLLTPPGSLPGGLRVEVNVLKGVVASQKMDETSKAHIQSALDQVKSGKHLDECLSQLSGPEKTLLADTIGNAGFEPPEQLNSYLTNKSQGDSSRMDCALKNVEVAESSGYQATEASALFRFLPLAPALLGG